MTCEASSSHLGSQNDSLSDVATRGVGNVGVQHDHVSDQSNIDVIEDDNRLLRKKKARQRTPKKTESLKNKDACH